MWKCARCACSSVTASSACDGDRLLAQPRARHLGKQVHALDHDPATLRYRALDERVDPGRDVLDLAQEAGDRRLVPLPQRRHGAARRRTRSGAPPA